MGSSRPVILGAVVFLTGAAVLIVEVVFLRVLAPFFGTTIYATSSMLGVVLGALAAGYALGGRVGDRRPEEWVFWAIVAASGAALLCSIFAARMLLPSLARLDVRIGVLLASVLLLPLPNVLLGMLSPFLIRLLANRGEITDFGRIAGNVFFVSTVGSIAGSLATGFFLIPHFRTYRILVAVGAGLLAIGVLGVLRRRPVSSFGIFSMLIGASLVLALGFSSIPTLEQGTRALVESPYAQLRVEDFAQDGRPVRALIMERSVAGGVYLDTWEPAFPYLEALRQLIAALPHRPERALVIGAGPYVIPNEILRQYPEVALTVVDIDPMLLGIGERWFRVDPSAFRNVVDDGRRFLRRSSDRYDFILLDAFVASYSIPVHLITEEFFALLRDHLAGDGVVVVNVVAGVPHAERFLSSVARTFETAFPSARMLPVGGIRRDQLQNFLIASQPIGDAAAWMAPEGIATGGLVFTDEYVPADTMLAPALKFVR